MSIGFILVSCRNTRTGDFERAVLPIEGIKNIVDSEGYKNKDGGGAVLFYGEKKTDLPSGGDLETMLKAVMSQSETAAYCTLESPEELFIKIAKSQMNIIDTTVYPKMTASEAIEHQKQRRAQESGKPVETAVPEENKSVDLCDDCPAKETCQLKDDSAAGQGDAASI